MGRTWGGRRGQDPAAAQGVRGEIWRAEVLGGHCTGAELGGSERKEGKGHAESKQKPLH